MYRRTVSISRLHELLSYDSTTGLFAWKVNRKGSARTGGTVGSRNHAGYRRTCIDGVDLLLHRIAWAMSYGEWPADMIDHINGDRSDNRLVNLRASDSTLNMQNRRAATRHNSTGLLGAYAMGRSSRFRAKIVVNGKQIVLGVFDTAEQAHQAYVEAKRSLHPACTI